MKKTTLLRQICVTNGYILHSTPLTHSEASASETKEKQKLLELAPSELKSSEGEKQYIGNLMYSLVT